MRVLLICACVCYFEKHTRSHILALIFQAEDNTAQYTYLTAKTLAGVMLAPGAKSTVEECSKALQSRLGELSKFSKAFVGDPSLLDKMARATKDVNDAISQVRGLMFKFYAN